MSRARRIAVAVAVAAGASLSLAMLLVPSTSSAYVARITNSTDTAASAANFTCAGAIAVDASNAIYQFPLTEATNSTSAANTVSASTPGTYRGSMTSSATPPLACPRDAGGAYVLDGTSSYLSTPTVQSTSPATFSTEVWFKTSVAGGRLIGYGNTQTGSSSQYDRHTYLATTGQLVFGTYNSGYDTIISPAGTSYADGAWHQVVSTFSAATGMILYVDGKQVAINAAYTAAEADQGYWRVGYDNLSGWTGTAANYYFKGSMRFAAVYKTALTAAQVQNHYVAGQ
jgi:hypothetical protein